MSRGITVGSLPLGHGVEGVGDEHQHNPDAGDDRAALADVPEVIGAQRLFGEPDYLIRVVSADLPSYQRLYESVLIHLPGVRGLNSTIVMKQAVHPRPLPGRPPRE